MKLKKEEQKGVKDGVNRAEGKVDNKHLCHPAIGKPWQTGESANYAVDGIFLLVLVVTVSDKQTNRQTHKQTPGSPCKYHHGHNGDDKCVAMCSQGW